LIRIKSKQYSCGEFLEREETKKLILFVTVVALFSSFAYCDDNTAFEKTLKAAEQGYANGKITQGYSKIIAKINQLLSIKQTDCF
jgi:hypothetical protein